ncbi:MAG: hydrogenase maturation nickel metallochaperone HypA [Cyclobacteriaceae bacterium]|nr:hydrogenase maturation nickel metallochaperone HypA [Cyclobacteriaceae bacterium]MCK5468032.1 hydrogenase maturation nickel metallochaperone HypA [Cyclobacteriaceae bacterium]
MHEVSIALNIIKIAGEELEKANGKGIEKIHLSVGKLSGVVIESLRFALDVSKKDGPLFNSEINIDEVPAKMKCQSCGHEFKADDFYITCPKCNEYKLEVLTGKELIIKSLTIY